MQNLVTALDDGRQDLRDARRVLGNQLHSYEVDHTVGEDVQAAIDWADEQLPDVRRRLALAEAIELEPKPEWPAGYVELADDTDISDVPPDEAERNGADAAEALLEGNEPLDPDVVAEIEANMDDPYFAAGFARNADPEQLAEFMDFQDALVDATEVDLNLRNRAFEVIGATIGTATRNTGDLAMPESYAQSWADAMTDESWQEGGDAPQGQAQYLALLMQQGKYGTDFLGHIGDEIYAYERDADGSPVWGPKAPMNNILDTNGQPVIDVMASYMAALGKNPDASQNFFNGGPMVTLEINGEDVRVRERMQYMLQERTWDYATDHTNGGYFGEALEAATTYYRDDGMDGSLSAALAGQTFALIGEETRTNDGWKMWNGMRDSVANMLASYSPDLLRVANSEKTDSAFGSSWTVSPETDLYGDGAPYGVVMDPELIEQILGTFGEDGNEEQLETVLAGVSGASQWRMAVALDESLDDKTPPPAPVAMLTGGNVPLLSTATNEMAAALGWVINGAYHGALDEEELEKKRAEMKAQVFDALTSVPGVGPAGKWSKFAFDQITSQIKDEIGSSEQTASGDFADLSGQEKEQLEQMIINQMLASGYWDEQYIEEANGGPDGTRYEAPPEDALVPGSDPPQIDFDSDAYLHWKRTKFPLDDFLNTHIYPSFTESLNDGLGMAER
ncbi:DUF6571 family protein [Phytoactinopolyspora mesophila]|uniref:DUF6571 domain-containing protein n=1 Tax=Phytoactinopolyspora mesophila TaxID=2650750 RepID=A0A7K3M6Q6_9ACTN|nr:DUF6571 family protein [Phytoactinopolyspora mesophila]NDL58935.1 hypothetical protein [Phytoactinopolyspora mesophila]